MKFAMNDNKIKGFFYPGNAVHGEPDYGLAENFVRTAEAFANTTYQSVYIIDYFRKQIMNTLTSFAHFCVQPI